MSEIKPALTPEEWRRYIEGYDGTLPIDRYIEEYRRLYGEDYTVEEMRAEYRKGAARDLLLADEGGYFTWDMVDGLRQMAKEGRDACRVGDNSAYPAMDPEDIDAIVDRIEALLPPRE